MTHPPAPVPGEDRLTSAEHIISSLKYLYFNCPIHEVRPIVRVALNLCCSAQKSAKMHDNSSIIGEELRPESFISVLEFLGGEARRNNLEDIEMILDAAYKLCFVTRYFQIRGEYARADLTLIDAKPEKS